MVSIECESARFAIFVVSGDRCRLASLLASVTAAPAGMPAVGRPARPSRLGAVQGAERPRREGTGNEQLSTRAGAGRARAIMDEGRGGQGMKQALTRAGAGRARNSYGRGQGWAGQGRGNDEWGIAVGRCCGGWFGNDGKWWLDSLLAAHYFCISSGRFLMERIVRQSSRLRIEIEASIPYRTLL